jgi:hypothetical protein
MSIALSRAVGVICIESLPQEIGERAMCDDSTLELLFESFVRSDRLDDDSCVGGSRMRWLASAGLSRWHDRSESFLSVRANLAQLMDDLQAEYDQISG